MAWVLTSMTWRVACMLVKNLVAIDTIGAVRSSGALLGDMDTSMGGGPGGGGLQCSLSYYRYYVVSDWARFGDGWDGRSVSNPIGGRGRRKAEEDVPAVPDRWHA